MVLIAHQQDDVQGAAERERDEPKPRTVLGIQETQFTLNGRPSFLLGISYYGGLGASEAGLQADLAEMKRDGFNWIRVWANWSSFTNDVSAVDGMGEARGKFFNRLQHLLAECDRRGMVVDISLSRGNGVAGPPRLQTLAAHRQAVETLVSGLKAWRNWYLDLSNERNIQDKRFTSLEDLANLREWARTLDGRRLVTASHAGDLSREELQKYLQEVRVDFIAPHRPRDRQSPEQTKTKTPEYLEWMKEIGRIVPVHYQEPFRRGYGNWQPLAQDFLTDALNAKTSGAAGWCFHNGDERNKSDGRPRRSFDMQELRLFDQLDEEESKAVKLLTSAIQQEER